MRIAIIGAKGIPGHHGVEVVVENVATRLAELDREVSILGYNSYFKGLKTYNGCDLIGFNGSDHYTLEMPTHVKNEVKYLLSHSQDFDVAHIHSVDPCLFTLALKRVFPMVVTSHGRVYKRREVGIVRKLASRLSEKAFIGTGQITTAVSPVDAEYYQEKYGKDIIYIPNGLDTPRNISDEHLQKWGLTTGGYMLFSAGRIIPSKGLHIVLEAYEKLETEIPLVVIGGPGYDGSYYQKMISQAPDNVLFTGFISDDSLWSLYGNASIAIFPSEYEAQSMTLLEFISIGVPVVFSDIPENLAVAKDIGLPFKSGNSNSLASSITMAITQKSNSNRDLQAIGNRIRKKHDWDSITTAYDKLYFRALDLFNSHLSSK